RRHTRFSRDWSSDVCSSDLTLPRTDVIAAVRAALALHADPQRAVGQQRYMKSSLPYLGLTSPVLRKALGPVLADPAYRIAERDRSEERRVGKATVNRWGAQH